MSALVVRSHDLLATVVTALLAGATAVMLAGTVLEFTRFQFLAGIAALLASTVSGLCAYAWWRRREVVVACTDRALEFHGASDWSVPWTGIRWAHICDVDSLVGPQTCLILRVAPSELTDELMRAARTSRALRWRIPSDRAAIIIPLEHDDAGQILAEVDSRPRPRHAA